MSRSCQSGMPSITGVDVRRGRSGPGRRSARDMIGFFLCGIALEPFWPGAERLRQLAHLGALAVPHLQRDRLADRGHDRQRRHPLADAVAHARPGSPRRPARRPSVRATAASTLRVDVRSTSRPRRRSSRPRPPRGPAAAGRGSGPSRRRSRPPGARRRPARRGCRGCGRPAACPGAPAPRSRSAATSASALASSMSVASTSCSASAVSSRSDEVMPKCTYAAASRGLGVVGPGGQERDHVVLGDRLDLGDRVRGRRRRRRAPARPPQAGTVPAAACASSTGARPGTTARTCGPRSRPRPSRAACSARSRRPVFQQPGEAAASRG